MAKSIVRLALLISRRLWIRTNGDRFAGNAPAGTFQNVIAEQTVRGLDQVPYFVPTLYYDVHTQNSHVPVGFRRSPGSSANVFYLESFIDELAHAAGRDPAEFRRALLGQHPRHLACLDLVVRKSRWGQPAEGCAQGIAVYESFNTVVAQVAEVRVEDDQLRVEQLLLADAVAVVKRAGGQ